MSIRHRFRIRALTALVAASCGMVVSPVIGQQVDPAVQAYRQALADKDLNPGLLIVDQGKELFYKKDGPKQASLEGCDFGLGPGVLKGAFAQMPRYMPDTGRVEDVEARLLHCMVTLQGKDPDQIKAKRFANETKNERNTDWEKIVAYVAAQSDGMPLKMAESPQVREAVRLGEYLFYKTVGPMDFSCATCHAEDGKRIRLQSLANVTSKADAQNVMRAWPTYRVSHSAVRTMQHRMWDCMWQMRLPDVDM
ncbi:MAG: sulfur oxidation c-type cytochrome SoxA, partial [Casimicrobiaceae bacterium]